MLARGLFVVACIAVAASAAPVPKGMKKPSDKFTPARFTPEHKRTPLGEVLEHFSAETGLEWVGDRPTELGTLTTRGNVVYTAVEWLDALNDRLEIDNLVLVRHGQTMYLHPAGRRLDPEKVDTVPVEDIPRRVAPAAPAARPAVPGWGGGWGGVVANPMPVVAEKPEPAKRGRTEVVTAVIELPKGLEFAAVRPQLVKSLSPFGQLEEDEGGKGVRVTDRVDTLQLLARVLTEKPK